MIKPINPFNHNVTFGSVNKTTEATMNSDKQEPYQEKDHCFVCGLKQDEPPWGEDGATPTYNICACCGNEAGVEDRSEGGIKRLRKHWIENRFPWFRPHKKPENWIPEKQLALVPPSVRYADEKIWEKIPLPQQG